MNVIARCMRSISVCHGLTVYIAIYGVYVRIMMHLGVISHHNVSLPNGHTHTKHKIAHTQYTCTPDRKRIIVTNGFIE